MVRVCAFIGRNRLYETEDTFRRKEAHEASPQRKSKKEIGWHAPLELTHELKNKTSAWQRILRG